MNYTCDVVLNFYFENILEKEKFMECCIDRFSQCEVDNISSLHSMITCEDWTVAEQIDEFAKDFTFDFIEAENAS